MTASPPAPPKPPARASRGRLILARILTVVGILLVVVSVLAVFVKRQALDSGQFRDTSRELIADKAVQEQVAATVVEQLYSHVDVADALEGRLPKNLKGLSGPIAGVARDGAETAARNMLARPRVQNLFVTAASTAQKELVAVLDGDTKLLQTSGGNVVLDLRPLVLELGQRFSFIPNLEDKIPPGQSQVTILRSDQLKTAQNVTKGLRVVANWIWILALAAWAAAVWLARGRRRIEVRAIAIGVLISGFLILIVQKIAGNYLVDHLVKSDTVRPAVARAYSIITEILRGAGWTGVLIGIVTITGVWLAGPGSRAVASRRTLAPYLRRPEYAYGGLVLGYLLLLWWKPTPQFGYPLNVVVFFVLAAIGLEVLRRQAAREFPNAEPADVLAAIRGTVSSTRSSRGSGDTVADLERLTKLRDSGAITQEEFEKIKAKALA